MDSESANLMDEIVSMIMQMPEDERREFLERLETQLNTNKTIPLKTTI